MSLGMFLENAAIVARDKNLGLDWDYGQDGIDVRLKKQEGQAEAGKVLLAQESASPWPCWTVIASCCGWKPTWALNLFLQRIFRR